MINFCDGHLKPKISCDKVSVDEYPVDNLISTDGMKLRKGFMGEYFIKPPVVITILFPCNIEISEIVINPIVGAQKSVGFEIYSSSSKVKESWINETDYKKCMTQTDSGALFLPIGKSLLPNAGTVCFKNKQYRPNSMFNVDSASQNESFVHFRELRHHKPQALNFVSGLNIRITRTESGKAVAIKSIQVWGQPARSSPKDIQEKIKKLFFETRPSPQQETNVKDDCYSKNDAAPSILKVQQTVSENGVDVPEEFIDAITCDVMNIPMILPCGKNIDQSTLEKHNSTEASWGRMPSDPFTGIPFTNKSTPVPNVPLKLRIDKFVLLHSEKLKHLPRTLGSGIFIGEQSDEIPSTSRLLSRPHSSKEMEEGTAPVTTSTYDSSQKTTRNRQITSYKNKSISSKTKEKYVPKQSREIVDLTEDSNSSEMIDLTKEKNKEKNSKGQKRSCATSVDGLHPVKKVRHEIDLQQSLDSALESALSCLPSFTKLSNTVNSTSSSSGTESNNGNQKQGEISSHCVHCQKTTLLYQAPCGHLYCKDCLSGQFNLSENKNTITDDWCEKIWQRKDIVKVHDRH